ncbi:geranylgeranylglyceryl/heptaprenylglyceryl phosphate synthase [Echinicola sp. CAU 1574]|uniref:Geranylgeranylglyceryl phosphate synthase n=1 Tax=Echinicola arenosa TaxID=2774144 RepID=A0ABR9AQI6_9BACT|nr:geranylgeranylglyceryl/heptaprenylglyceryl phosphate synthase [Echinicola arenosa]MBD8491056.1 geranylgeranylglyceryl/heptaprenylglyceryl phosphate synthase [Echinicola arenosa]
MPAEKSDQIFKAFKQLHQSGKKALALLIDPEKIGTESQFKRLIKQAYQDEVDFFFIGGSLLTEKNVDKTVMRIKEVCADIPVVLFPGNVIQISPLADGILFLSLISGRNPELLIGQHVTAAPLLANTKLEVLPTGYMLVNDGQISSASYISQTIPIPNNKPSLAKATALAGKFLGLQTFFLDAGSGASTPVSKEIIKNVKQATQFPLIVGGGINSVEKARNAWDAGADIVVLGNGVEKNPDLLTEVLDFMKVYNLSLNVN